MKKTVKIISTILLVAMLIATLAGVAFAAVDPEQVISGVENGSTVSDTSDIEKIGANIVNIIQVVGIVIAIIVLLIIGIRYLVGSPEQKSEYKKTMVPYIVGAVLVFAGTSIVKVVYQLSTQVKVG